MNIFPLIIDMIADEVKEVRGLNAWISRGYIIREVLLKLGPTTPEDDSFGFVAYDVPDKARMKMKTGKFLTRKLKLNTGYLNDVSLRRIADNINKTLNPDCNCRIVSGDGIYQNYRDAIGGSSCMTGSDADKTGLYSDNTGVYRMLVMVSGNDSARAMIIKLDNGDFLLDRIYCTAEFLYNKMIDKAQKEKWYYRTSKNAGCYDVSDCNGNIVSDYSFFTVSDLIYTDGECPYQDTLTRYRLSSRYLDLTHPMSCNSYDGCLDTTDGRLEDENSGNCCHCGTRENYDDLYSDDNGDHYCDECWNDLFFYCEKCCQSYPTTNSIEIQDKGQYWCSDCAVNYAVKCEDCGTYFFEDYYIVEGSCYCTDCTEKFSRCSACDELATETNDVEDSCYCSDCWEDLPECCKCNVKVLEVSADGYCDECQTERDDNEEAEKQYRENAENMAYFNKEDIFQI